MVLFYKMFKNSKTKCGKLVGFVFMFFTFTVYVRSLIEAYMLILLSCEEEIYKLNFSKNFLKVSYGISIIVILFLLLILLMVYIIGKYSLKANYDTSKSYFKEIVDGTKGTRYGRQAVAMLLIRII